MLLFFYLWGVFMYSGKSNLRGQGETYEFTPERLSEFFRCAEDIVYFAENYFYIDSVDEDRHKIKLFEFQKKALKCFTSPTPIDGRKNAIINIPRQMGKCFFSDSSVKIRNTKTGEINDLRVDNFFDKCV